MVPFSDETDRLGTYAGATVLCGEKTLSFKSWRLPARIVHRDGYEGGAGLADILSGYAIWAPGTVIIKSLTAFCFTAKNASTKLKV